MSHWRFTSSVYAQRAVVFLLEPKTLAPQIALHHDKASAGLYNTRILGVVCAQLTMWPLCVSPSAWGETESHGAAAC